MANRIIDCPDQHDSDEQQTRESAISTSLAGQRVEETQVAGGVLGTRGGTGLEEGSDGPVHEKPDSGQSLEYLPSISRSGGQGGHGDTCVLYQLHLVVYKACELTLEQIEAT